MKSISGKKFRNAEPSLGDYTPPIGYVQVAMDGEVRSFANPTNLAYGVNGVFNYKSNVKGTITFDNATFGDPYKYVRKGGFAEAAYASATNQLNQDATDAANTLSAQNDVQAMATDYAASNTPATTSSINKWVIIGIVGAALIAITFIVIMAKRKKK